MNVTRIRAPQLKPNIVLKLASLILACLLNMTANAAIDVYDFDSPQQEAQYRGLIEEFRCPKCQNQNLAASDAPIAQDLKQKVYDLIKDRRSDAEIRVYMQERYGDFISYKPLCDHQHGSYGFPPLLLLVLIIGWFWQSKRRQVVARGQSGVTVNSTAALTSTEKAELDRLLSQAESVDHDITSLEDKK